MTELINRDLRCGCSVVWVGGVRFMTEIADECTIHNPRFRHTLDEDELHDR
jgi:hypothetical protein